MTLNIGLSEEQLKGSTTILTQLLANEFTLYVKTRKYHWNVVGPQFHDLHKFFETLYEELDEISDEVAERIRSLGKFAIGTLAEFSEHTKIKEESKQNPNQVDTIKNLLADHEQIIRELRLDITKVDQEYGDVGTADFLTAILEKHEKNAWMLRSMLE